jgi:hypothetical protein
MRRIVSGWYWGVLLLLPACFLIPEEQTTIVQGTVINRMTRAKAIQVPMEVWECQVGLHGRCDLLQTQLTDTNANYQISFTSRKGHYYQVDIGNNIRYAQYGNPVEGITLKAGKLNVRDFQVTPYKILAVNLLVNQAGKDRFILNFRNAFQGSISLGGPVWIDETKRFRQIDTTFYLPVFPRQSYQFDASFCDKVAEFEYENCEFIYPPNVYVDYVDTTHHRIVID